MASITLHLTLKNFLSLVVGACVVGLALIPLVISTDHLVLLRWKVGIGVLATLALAGLFCQALRQSREETEQWQTIQGIAEKLEALLPSGVKQQTAVLSHTLKDSDPRVFVEFSDDWEGMFNHNALILINRGHTEAQNVRVSEIRLRARTIKFDQIIPVIAAGSRSSIAPNIDDYGLFQRQDVPRALMEEWNSYNDITKNDLSVSMTIIYQDFAHSVFQTSCDVVLNPFNYIRRSAGQGKDRPIIEIANFSFSRVSVPV